MLRSVCESDRWRSGEFADHEPISASLEGRHAQIDVRSQPPVQLNLTDAVRIAFRASREVQETEVDRLPELVNAARRQKQMGYMGLDVLDP
jgi:hypothetical protein